MESDYLMSKWGLKYKGVEILTPEEWNKVVDALEELDSRCVAGANTFLGLADTPDSYTGQANKFVKVKATEDGLEFAEAVGGVTTFLGLTDTPDSYSGQAGKFVRVKTTENGLEFSPISLRFTDLIDVPNSYSGQGGKVVKVKATEDGLEFSAVAGGVSTFLELTDTPDSYSGQGGKVVSVKATEDGLEFTTPTGAGATMIGFGEAGWIIDYGDVQEHQPFSSSKGSSKGMPVPFAGKAKNMLVQIVSNSLDADCYVNLRKNEETMATLTIPSGTTGLVTLDNIDIEYALGDRIDFEVDATSATSGSIDIAGISVKYVPV